MKRICILKPNENAYSETFIASQIQLLKPVKVLYDGWLPSLDSETKQSFLYFPLNLKLFRGSFRSFAPNLYKKVFQSQLSRYLIKNKIDILLANYGLMGANVLDACTLVGVKLVVHFHGFDAHHYSTIARYYPLYQKLFKSNAEIIVVSQEMKEALQKMGAKNLWVNPYAVNASLFKAGNPEKQAVLFLFAGRLTAKKSPQNLLRAFAQTKKEIPDARLIIVGDGGLLKECQELAETLGVKNSVAFLGKKSHKEVAQLMQTARCFVQHSITAEDGDKEGTPNTILEASSSGLPVISTKHAGIKEAVIHGETGFLVEENDWQAMAKYMILIGNDPQLAGKMGLAGREHILNNYSLERQTAIFKEILGKDAF